MFCLTDVLRLAKVDHVNGDAVVVHARRVRVDAGVAGRRAAGSVVVEHGV